FCISGEQDCLVYQQSSSLSVWAHCCGWLSRAMQSSVLTVNHTPPPPIKTLPSHSYPLIAPHC
ncbi:unnamed protein product, partial [Staurois parvus]